MIPLQAIGGSAQAPPLLFYPGNGFPPACHAPLLAPLTHDWRVLCLPPRALWPEGGPAPAEPGALNELAADLLAGMEQHALREVLAVGHSLGANVLMAAALEQPQRFRGLALLDPVMLSRERIEFIRASRERGDLTQLPLVAGALKRRERFPDLQTAFAYWRSKALFADMSDAALWVYTRAATCPAQDGAGLQLTWPRDWEARYFMLAGMDLQESLAGLNSLTRTLILHGAASDVLDADALQRARRRLPTATVVTLPDCGHLFPLDHPQQTRAALRDWLATLG